MSDHRTALLPFSTLATYVPEGDHDTALMAELRGERQGQVTSPEGQGSSGYRPVVPVQSAVNLPGQNVPDVQNAIS